MVDYSLDTFFDSINLFASEFQIHTDEAPKLLYINPKILATVAKLPGFFQRTETSTQATIHSPIVSRFKLKTGIVQIVEDYDEPFLHFR